MAPSTGQRFGPYELLSRIGAGGMGEVWKAMDTRLNRIVAIKFSNTDFSDRFDREARAIAALNHPHICQLYDVGPNYLVMEFVDGVLLAGPMPVEKAVAYACQILDALDAAHRRGIAHRDLKPANVLVTKDGGVKLLDFGLATQSVPLSAGDSTVTRALTSKGEIAGTLQYMAPEQLQGATADARSDLFSFGCVLYELLAGLKAFDGPSAADVVAAVMDRDPARLSNAALDRIVRRCLAKDPDQRFQNARDLKIALLWAMEEPAAPKAGSSGRLAAAALAIGLAALGAGWAAGRFRVSQPVRPMRSFLLPPSTYSFRCQGDDGGPAVLSPDGARMAFSATGPDGKVLLWTERLDDAATVPLAGTDGAMFPFWSPDSRFLGFFADSKLKKVDAGGGAVTVVADSGISRGGAWNSEDVIVFAPRITSPMLRTSASGGGVTQVTQLDAKQAEISHRWPSFLPDGKHFLYTSRGRGIFLASVDGSIPPRRLLEESSNAQYSAGFLLYSRESTLLARPFDVRRLQFTGPPVTVAQSVQSDIDSDRGCFSASASGLLAYHADRSESQLTWFDRNGTRVGTIGDPGLFLSADLSPDGTHIAAVTSDATGNATLWLYDLGLNSRRRLASMEAVNLAVAWSPDSRSLVIATRRAGSYVVYAKDIASGAETAIVQSNLEVRPASWSVTGGLTLNTRNPSTGWDIDYLPPGEPGHRSPTPILHTEGDENEPLLSPDSHRLLYTHVDFGDIDSHVYVASFPDVRDALQVSNDSVGAIRWNPNGKEIFYGAHNRIVSVGIRIEGGKLQVGPPRTLFQIRSECNYMYLGLCFDVTPDGNRFLVIDAVGSPAPVALFQNWTATLKK
jgi:Tol biopolymer transport system component